ncbi:MAG: sigma-70 family RNA polymerase sigma factor [Tannerellaceae bacterium]|jgi:RNA polymerase sigma-70 factor (ECF subfamily)|nr:sigma-70 family RNA polymerase sigma factor [Tannerellaceae bacterium]
MDESTKHLVDACRRGSKPAQLYLYKKYASKLYMACLRITGNKMDAEESMHDAFLKVFGRLDLFREEQNFEAWIHRIAVHAAIDFVRQKAVELEDLSPNYTGPDEEDETQEESDRYAVEQIKEAVQKLPAGYRVVLSLYLFEGYDTEEIASILKIQPASVRTQYLRAKRKLLDITAIN